MRRFLLASIFLALCLPTWAQNVGDNITASGNAGGGVPSGSAGGVLSGTYPNPGFAASPTFTGIGTITGATTTVPGWYAGLTGDTVQRTKLGLDAVDNPVLAMGPGGATTRDTFLGRTGAAIWQFGAVDAAAPVSQTTNVQSVVAGTTDTAGVDWFLTASKGTGTGAGGRYIFRVAPAASATASTQNAPVNAMTIAPTGNGTGGATSTVAMLGITQTQQVTGVLKAVSISSNTLTLDLSLGNDFTVTANAVASTINFNNPVAGKANFFSITITGNGTVFAFTWPAAVRWPAGLAPTLTGTNNKVDIFTFYTPDGGTNWYGSTFGQNM